MDLGDPRGARQIYGAVSSSGELRELAEVLIATVDGEVAVGPGGVARPEGGGAEVLLLDAAARDHAGVAAFAAALIAGAREAQRTAQGERRTA
jgi:hypothetical protein